GRRRIDLDTLGDIADLKRDVDIQRIADMRLDPLAFDLLEPGDFDGEGVGTRQQIGDRVIAALVAASDRRGAGFFVHYANFSPGDDCSTHFANPAGNCAASLLRP